MAFNEFIGNRGGIPLVAATQTTAGSATANAVFSMPNHTFRAMGVTGIMVINFSAATTTATGFDIYDELPEDMVVYLRYNGRHFNRKLVEFATSKMTTRDSNGTEIALEPITREQLDNMMKQSNVHLTNNDNPYDAVFVANMCKADYLGSSVPDGLHLCLYVKDVIDDVDGYDGIAFNRWYADMCRKGIQIDWYNCR
jgi:hypothetical protein